MDDTLRKIAVTFAKWCHFKRQCYSSVEHSAKQYIYRKKRSNAYLA